MARLLAAALAATVLGLLPPPPLPTVHPNDNRTPAGQLRGGVLTLRLVVGMARWYPEADAGPWLDVAAFAEEGRAPQVPAPLIRVPTGTTIVATVRNTVADSTIYVHGFTTKPAAATDSVAVPPGESRTVRFAAGAPGSYVYWATAGTVNYDIREREQLSGALVIDEVGAHPSDRIFVLNIWGEPKDSTHYRNALAINGKSWPFTERITATVGDSLRWRVINGTTRNHPMHLHGFYFQVAAHGTIMRDSVYPAAARRLVVTEDLSARETMEMAWQVNRPGNWLFHCHITFHVMADARLDPPPLGAHDWHALDPGKHMAGLVLGISVRPGPGWVDPARPAPRRIHLFVDEGRGPKRARAPRALAFVLQRGDVPPAADSVELPGSTLVLTRDEPTDITVVNRLAEATAIHWHGIELASYSDGVAGWSGGGPRLAPVIAAHDSFTAHLTLPRAGTFMYHTHLNDLEQLSSGLYGGIVVLEPGRPFDPRTDHLFVAGWDGQEDPPHIVVNGDSLPPPLDLAYGVPHRLRFVNIGAAVRLIFAVRRDSTLAQWRPLAKDGAELPAQLATPAPAAVRVAVGETYDVEFVPPAPGEYRITVGPPAKQMTYVRRLIVR